MKREDLTLHHPDPQAPYIRKNAEQRRMARNSPKLVTDRETMAKTKTTKNEGGSETIANPTKVRSIIDRGTLSPKEANSLLSACAVGGLPRSRASAVAAMTAAQVLYEDARYDALSARIVHDEVSALERAERDPAIERLIKAGSTKTDAKDNKEKDERYKEVADKLSEAKRLLDVTSTAESLARRRLNYWQTVCQMLASPYQMDDIITWQQAPGALD